MNVVAREIEFRRSVSFVYPSVRMIQLQPEFTTIIFILCYTWHEIDTLRKSHNAYYRF